METQFTPGPQDHGFSIWQPQIDALLLANSELRAERDAARLASMLGCDENGAVIACYIGDIVDQRDKLRAVNAELLEALTAMVALVRDDSKSPRRISACMAAASAAIAKAQP